MHTGHVHALTHTYNHSCILGRNVEGNESADGHIFGMITFICVAAGSSLHLVGTLTRSPAHMRS